MYEKFVCAFGILMASSTLSMAQMNHENHEWHHHKWNKMRVCESTEPLYVKRLMRIEYTVNPKADQVQLFDALKTAAQKAFDARRAGCPTPDEKRDQSPIGRMNIAEKMMTANLEALKIYKPAFAAFYAKLDDVQKDRLRWMNRGNWHQQ